VIAYRARELIFSGVGSKRFAKIAGLCRVRFRVTELDDLDAALAGALRHPGPALVEILTDALFI